MHRKSNKATVQLDKQGQRFDPAVLIVHLVWDLGFANPAFRDFIGEIRQISFASFKTATYSATLHADHDSLRASQL